MDVKTFAVTVAAALFAGAAGAYDTNAGPVAKDATAGSLKPNQGQVLCTAAVNSDGTLAGKLNGATASSSRLATGEYQVVFFNPCTNITAANGWARWVQVDTLTIGSLAGYCTTADRSGNPNGVFVQCRAPDGTLADKSFFLFVAR